MTIIPIFLFCVLIYLPSHIKSEVVIKFNRQYSLYEYENLFLVNIQFFADYFINNKYLTDIYIGDPKQKIPGYLNPAQSGFYLTEKSCPSKVVYQYKNSWNYKLISKKEYGAVTIQRFYDAIHFEYANNTDFSEPNYEFFSDKNLNNSICVNIGTKLLGYGESVEDNLLNRLHSYKSINSYYFSYIYDSKNDDKLNYIFDIDIKNNEKKYTFIKASSYSKDNRQYLVWGLDFGSLKLNNHAIYEKQFRAELNINLGCIIGSSSFKDTFDSLLEKNNIDAFIQNYDNEYDIYIFNKKSDYNKLKNITLSFFHKSLDYNFTLNYQDLFYEKDEQFYFLIIFNNNQEDFWEFGAPFLRKYNFIYNQDNKFMGFIKDNKAEEFNGKTNTGNNNNKTKIILVIALIVILVIIVTLFFGFLIGKKMYKVRKNKTNELLELYDYNSKNDTNNK